MNQEFSGEKSQKQIIDELMTDKISAIMWALEGASRVRQNKGIHQYTRSQQAQAEWMADADSVLGFLAHACEPSENPPQATGREIYEAYLQWCALSGRKPLKYNTVCKRLTSQGIKPWRTESNRGYCLAIRPAALRNPG
jgi:phage/plasmid-associated DNA primase